MFNTALPTIRRVVSKRYPNKLLRSRPSEPDKFTFRCAKEILGATLLSWHNLHYYQDLMRGLRNAIAEGALDAFTAIFAAEQNAGDIDPL